MAQRHPRRRQDDDQLPRAAADPRFPGARRREGRRDAHGHQAGAALARQLPALAALAAARGRDRPPRTGLHRRHPGDADDRPGRAVLARDQQRPRPPCHPGTALRPPRRPGHPARTHRAGQRPRPLHVPPRIPRALRRGGPHLAARRGRGHRHHPHHPGRGRPADRRRAQDLRPRWPRAVKSLVAHEVNAGPWAYAPTSDVRAVEDRPQHRPRTLVDRVGGLLEDLEHCVLPRQDTAPGRGDVRRELLRRPDRRGVLGLRAEAGPHRHPLRPRRPRDRAGSRQDLSRLPQGRCPPGPGERLTSRARERPGPGVVPPGLLPARDIHPRIPSRTPGRPPTRRNCPRTNARPVNRSRFSGTRAGDVTLGVRARGHPGARAAGRQSHRPDSRRL
ncbi:hypothetical protein SCOCK_760006 [Actinacidiphila cocklensis]|uniref:Uncharacterized protein n=1 Tax=Actinacidiphila cocklensis TaxID=887465 RepID=A0A9W4E418_9ACTN|nr:hypothetical protein SCOCK_760006 [Actinacidiphila cocklensis]